MRSHLLSLLLTLGLCMAFVRPVSAQASDAHQRGPAVRPGSSSLWIPAAAAPESRDGAIPRASDGRDHTVLGLVIGAVVGFGAGWALYDAICEAVDNRCSDSRLPHLVIGTGLGASLGALLGSAVD